MDSKRLHQLIDRFNQDRISESDKKELLNYYNAFQIRQDWDADRFGDYNEVRARIFNKVMATEQINKKSRGFSRLVRLSWIRGVAAIGLIFLLAGIGYMGYVRWSEDIVVITSGLDPREVILPDGSRVVLNTDSRISYPRKFESNIRTVEFEGEGYFTVETNPQKPFVIHADRFQVKVVGTEFNLKAYREESTMETALIKGRVEIYGQDGKEQLAILDPDQKFVADKDGMLHSQSGKTETREYMEVIPLPYTKDVEEIPVDIAWKEGKLAFHTTSLEDIARQIKRKHGITIRFQNEEAKGYRYTATFEHESFDEILRALRLVKRFEYRKEGDDIVIY